MCLRVCVCVHCKTECAKAKAQLPMNIMYVCCVYYLNHLPSTFCGYFRRIPIKWAIAIRWWLVWIGCDQHAQFRVRKQWTSENLFWNAICRMQNEEIFNIKLWNTIADIPKSSSMKMRFMNTIIDVDNIGQWILFRKNSCIVEHILVFFIVEISGYHIQSNTIKYSWCIPSYSWLNILKSVFKSPVNRKLNLWFLLLKLNEELFQIELGNCRRVHLKCIYDFI